MYKRQVEQSPESVVITDAEARIEYVNDASASVMTTLSGLCSTTCDSLRS